LSKSGATGAQLIETKHINKSLAALGNVVSALQEKKTHIPYRDSKLTFLLQDSFCGNSKVLLMMQMSPSAVHSSESVCTLSFASRAQNVQLGSAKKNMFKFGEEAGTKSKEQISKLKEDLRAKDELLRVTKEKVSNLEEKINKLEKANRDMADRVRSKEKVIQEEVKKRKDLEEKAKKKQDKLDKKEQEKAKKEQIEREKAQEKASVFEKAVEKALLYPRDSIGDHCQDSMKTKRLYWRFNVNTVAADDHRLLQC
jgi:DNA repair exonuclease SbcCD ATPase subunit